MVVRVTVTLPEETLAQLDTIARDEGVTRSDVVREATADYVTRRHSTAEATARHQAVEDGICWLEGVAARSAGERGPATLEVLRELRDGQPAAGAPLAPEKRKGPRR